MSEAELQMISELKTINNWLNMIVVIIGIIIAFYLAMWIYKGIIKHWVRSLLKFNI